MNEDARASPGEGSMGEVARAFAGTPITAIVLDTDDFAASALKMAYGGFQKASLRLFWATS